MISLDLFNRPLLFLFLHGFLTLIKGQNDLADFDEPNAWLDDIPNLADIGNPICLWISTFFYILADILSTGPIVYNDDIIQATLQDLLDYELAHASNPGLIPKNPTSAAVYDIECPRGYVPQQSLFPEGYDTFDYPSLYDLCSFFSTVSARHLAFVCKYP